MTLNIIPHLSLFDLIILQSVYIYHIYLYLTSRLCHMYTVEK